MKISYQEVEYAARLGRLELSTEETGEMAEQLDRILQYVAKLDELDTTSVAPTFHTLALTNAFRADDVKPSLGQPEALANAPEHNGEAFIVPRVIEKP